MAIMLGTLDSDRVKGTAAADIITSLSGADRISGGRGADLIDAGAGDDIVFTALRDEPDDGARDTVLAGSGNDTVHAAYGDAVNGGSDFDTLYLDLSRADRGVEADFRPQQLSLDLLGSDLLSIVIGGASIGGFEAVRRIDGSAFDDVLITQNRDGSTAFMSGGAGDDYLRSGSGDDRLDGGDGNDRLVGGTGRDFLTGGAGRDIFIFTDGRSGADARSADRIEDFSRADRDRISLSAIDAVEGGEDDAFHFIGAAAFSGVAGELRAEAHGARTLLSGDVDGDGAADFMIAVYGDQGIVASDLML